MKVAIVCDWILGIGGAERVVLELHRLYPDAPIYTSQYDAKKMTLYEGFQDADVRTGWLQNLPGALKKFLPVLRAWYFSRLDLSEYDLILSASGAEAKAVRPGKGKVHICYLHAPTHYYWSKYEEYVKNPGLPRGTNWIGKIGLRLLVEPLRAWDKRAAKAPTVMLANSTHTAAMIKKYYKREAEVVWPPVDIDRFTPSDQPRHGYVAVGRQTPYKRIDLAVAACTQLNETLIVIGSGPDHKKLEKMAGRSVTFFENASDETVARHMQTARALIFPTNIEDFGVTGVEALAAGTPVIAYAKGGPKDYVIPGKTGALFKKQTVESLVETLQDFKPERYDPSKLREFSKDFSVRAFRKRMQDVIKRATAD
jgi:glycosyltransferase involved in cell wall biosynthesis